MYFLSCVSLARSQEDTGEQQRACDCSRGRFHPCHKDWVGTAGKERLRVSGPAGGLAAPRAGWEGGQDGCQRDDIAGRVSDP